MKKTRTRPAAKIEDLESRRMMSVATTTAIAMPEATSNVAAGDTLTATVSSTSANFSPTGTISFYADATLIGTAPLHGLNASLVAGHIPSDARLFYATYNGDATYDESTSRRLFLDVIKRGDDQGDGGDDNGDGGDDDNGDGGDDNGDTIDTFVELNSDSDEVSPGDPVTFTATVTPDFDGDEPPSGMVIFRLGDAVLGRATLDGDATAEITIKSLPGGDDDIVASYVGDATYNASDSDPTTVTVDSADVTIPTPAVASSYAFGAKGTISTSFTSARKLPYGGTADLIDGDGNVLLSVNLTSKGMAKFPVAALDPGDHVVHISFDGDENHSDAESGEFTLHVSRASSAVGLSVANANGTVLLTANVASSFDGDPTGTVTFYDGKTSLGTADLDDANPATFTVNNLAGGSHVFSATYAGDDTYAPATSASKKLTMKKIAPKENLSFSGDVLIANTPTTISIALSPAAALFSGTVRILDAGRLLGTATVASGGTASFDFTFAKAGRHTIKAIYSGDSFHSGTTATVKTTVS